MEMHSKELLSSAFFFSLKGKDKGDLLQLNFSSFRNAKKLTTLNLSFELE